MPGRDRAIRGLSVRGRLHECGDKADTPRLRPKRASASIPLSGRSFGEAQGESDGADAVLSRLRSPGGLFIYHVVRSEMEAAADSFAKAIAQGEVQHLMWLGASDFLRPLRSSPRWPALAKMMNLPSETSSN